MTTPDRIPGLLHDLAGRFEEEVQEPGAWGQFLDVPKRHVQIGWYGTSAGLMTVALAERGPDALARQAARQLGAWWTDRALTEHEAARAVQNLRLAFMHLAMRLGTTDHGGTEQREVREELLSRLLPSGQWGDYWSSNDRHDQTPRAFTSAIVLLSFALARPAATILDPRLMVVADRLEQRICSGGMIPPHEVAAVAMAVLASKGVDASLKFRRKIARSARARPPALDEQGVYFFDYEYEHNGQHRYGRDYFIVPTRILFALAGFQAGAPSSLQLLAQSTLDLLADNLAAHAGTYRSEPGARVSTVDQAWVALLLKAGLAPPDPPGIVSRAWYWLVRIRRPHWLLDTAFPILAMAIAVSLSNVVTSLNRQEPDPVVWADVVANLCSFFIVGLYGARFLQRVFPGRQ